MTSSNKKVGPTEKVVLYLSCEDCEALQQSVLKASETGAEKRLWECLHESAWTTDYVNHPEPTPLTRVVGEGSQPLTPAWCPAKGEDKAGYFV